MCPANRKVENDPSFRQHKGVSMFIHIRWLCVIAIVAVIAFGGVTYWMVRRANEAEYRRILDAADAERQRQDDEFYRTQRENRRELERLEQEERRWDQEEARRFIEQEQLNEQRRIRQAIQNAELFRRY